MYNIVVRIHTDYKNKRTMIAVQMWFFGLTFKKKYGLLRGFSSLMVINNIKEGHLIGLLAWTCSPISPDICLEKLNHVSALVLARFGLVDAKRSSKGTHPGLPNIAYLHPIIHSTALFCWAETDSPLIYLFPEQDNSTM
jgi:hypothetical protein